MGPMEMTLDQVLLHLGPPEYSSLCDDHCCPGCGPVTGTKRPGGAGGQLGRLSRLARPPAPGWTFRRGYVKCSAPGARQARRRLATRQVLAFATPSSVLILQPPPPGGKRRWPPASSTTCTSGRQPSITCSFQRSHRAELGSRLLHTINYVRHAMASLKFGLYYLNLFQSTILFHLWTPQRWPYSSTPTTSSPSTALSPSCLVTTPSDCCPPPPTTYILATVERQRHSWKQVVNCIVEHFISINLLIPLRGKQVHSDGQLVGNHLFRHPGSLPEKPMPSVVNLGMERAVR